MTLDDTLKFSMQRMTAYQNVEKEHGYNICHAYGREGHGKGLGSYGCMNIIISCLCSHIQSQGDLLDLNV